MCLSCGDSYPVPIKRDFRRKMKHSTLRKMTAMQRIEMNRFWNELEEISNRLEEVRVDYDDECSTIEEAQNVLNETFECDNEVEAAFATCVTNADFCWCKKDERREEENESSYWSDTSFDERCSSGDVSEDDEGYQSFLSEKSSSEYHNLPLPPSFKETKQLLSKFHSEMKFLL